MSQGAQTRFLAALALLMSAVSLASAEAQAQLAQGIELYWSGRYRDSVDVLSSSCVSEGRDDERIECLKYLAFSHVALGESEGASGAFAELLALDPGYSLDPSAVSPKLQRQFEEARRAFVDELFQQGKDLYFRNSFAEAKAVMGKVLDIDPEYRLAKEYDELAAERTELTEERRQAEQEPVEPSGLASVAEEVDADRVYHMTSRITPPELLVRVDPDYPLSARRVRREGSVVLTIVIERDGSVRDPKVIRSVSPDLDRAAIDAVLRWRYRAALLDAQPVAVYSVIHLNFELQ